MQVADVRALYDYNAWANARILGTAARVTGEQFVAPAAFSQGGLRGTLLHTLGAERIWRERLQGVPLSPPLREADFPDVGTLAARWREEASRLDALWWLACSSAQLLGAPVAIWRGCRRG